MRRHHAVLLGALACLVLVPALALAGTDTETLTINATVSARVQLVIAPTTINFPDADPETVDPIPANENSVNVLSRIRTSAAGASTLTCLANGELVSGTDVIDIDNVTWTSAGSGYVDGTMSSAAAQSAGSFTGSGAFTGSFSYFLANSWDYTVGNYTQTVLYTLTTP